MSPVYEYNQPSATCEESQSPCTTVLFIRDVGVAQGDCSNRSVLQFVLTEIPVPRDIREQ